MTTITIERAFLIKVLDHLDIAQSLLERSQHHAKIAAMYKELRAALAAPATAPAQPAPERKPMTDEKKEELAGAWFAEDWAKKSAIGMLDDYEKFNGIKP